MQAVPDPDPARRPARRFGSVSRVTRSPAETLALARRLGTRLDRGDRLLLLGTLGAGKTCFVQGLAEGLGVDPSLRVTSQTFTLLGLYPGRIPLYHFDAYRVGGPEELVEWGDEALLGEDGVVVVEWGEGLKRDLPEPILFVRFTILGNQDRRIRFYSRASRFRPVLAEIGRED